MERKKSKKEPLTTSQVADYCHVTYRAVLKWIDEGKLKGYRTPGKHCRIEIADFIEFLNTYHMPIPEELKPKSGKVRVLIVDDDQKIVQLISKSLEIKGLYEIKTASDGFAAGRIFSDFQPDLVLLDINMPGLDGYQVCAQIRSNPKNKEVKILAVSGLIDGEGKKILKIGANDCLAKPFEVDDLISKVEMLLGLKKENKGEETPLNGSERLGR